MATLARLPYDEPEVSSSKWVAIFVLISLLVHALVIAAILSITTFMPKWKPTVPEAPTVNVTMVAPPVPPVPKKPIFIPTTPQANVPHKEQLMESANDTELTSKSTLARNPDSIMPDVIGKEHESSLNSKPNLQAPQKPEVSSTPPIPKPPTPQKPAKPQPPTPLARVAPEARPLPPNPKPAPPNPTPPKPQPAVDDNGLPVLPAIPAPTMAQVNPALASPPPAAVSQPLQATSVHGALGRSGDNSPASMATELGKYKQYVYSVVGSYWYPDIDAHFGIIPVGMVHIQFTIHSDGRVTDVVILQGDSLEQLKVISRRALVAPAPYKPFSDAMIKQVGESYTDDFTFSVY